jgi:hypothetical protein
MLTPEVADARVAEGVKLLNAKSRGWKSRLTSPVNIALYDQCVGGQLNADKGFFFFADVLDYDAQKGVDGGFALAPDEVSPDAYKTLTRAWQKII